MNPIVDYLSTLLKYRADARYVPRSLLYLLKAVVWEPFRYGERAVMRVRSEPGTLPHPPFCILGYYRSGTTHLQETLLQDPQFAYMNFYQGFFPAAFTSTEAWVKPVFERIVKRMGMLHPAHQIPFSFELPAEEDVSMVASGFRLAANWGQVFPKRFKEIYGRTGLLDGITPGELAALKEHLHDLFWRVSKANGHKRLLLKSPPQLGRLGMLLDMYPDAKFVFIRRNPYDVFASNNKLWQSFEKSWLQDGDAGTVRDYILWSFDQCHLAYERDKVRARPGQLCEIAFEEFQAAPMEVLHHVYRTVDLGDFDRARPRFAAYLEKKHRSSLPPYHFTKEEHDAIAAGLGRWLRAWRYEPGGAGATPSIPVAAVA